MSADSSAFSCLPLAVRDSVLQQAFQQLDQRHLFGVAPRVCRLWHQLSLSIITSLDATISTAAAAEQIKCWIRRHGAGLISLDLLLGPAAWSLLQSLQVAKKLRSLRLSGASRSTTGDFSLHTLTSLTSLSLSNCDPTTAARASILGLTKLSSLSLRGIRGVNFGPFLEQVSTSLVGLTKLDLSDNDIYGDELAHLQNFPQLKELLTSGYFHANKLVAVGALSFTSVGISVGHNTVGRACLCLQTASGQMQKLALLGHGPQAVPALDLPVLQLGKLKEFRACNLSVNMVHVAALTQLTQLELTDCGLDDAALCTLSSLCNLRVLKLSYNLQITGAQGSMEVLARSMPQLTFLVVGGWKCERCAEFAAEAAFRQRLVGSYRDVHYSRVGLSLKASAT